MADSIYGDSGNNTLTGTPNADLILGFQGQDTIYGNGGSDTLVGGQGADSIQFGNFNEEEGPVQEGSDNGSPLIYGSEGADTIIGGFTSGNVTIVGDTGNSSIDSVSGGSDLIEAIEDTGSDLILGNYGDDTIFVEGFQNNDFGSPTQTDTIAGGFGNDTIYEISNKQAIVYGNQGNDLISAFNSQNTVIGGKGNDTIQAQSFGSNENDDGTTDAIGLTYGGEGNDVIFVSGGNNTVLGGTGIASVDSLAGAAGDGNDSIVIGQSDPDGEFFFGGENVPGNDLILGNYGDDTIDASGQAQSNSSMDTLVGGQGNDVIFGGQTVNNFIFGNQGNDAISDTLAGAGTDTVAGGMGNDTIVVGTIPTVTGSTTMSPTMTLTISTISVAEAAVTPADTIFGANYLVYGNEGNNSISVQGVGNDTIYGGNTSTDAVGNGDGGNIINITSQTSGNDLIFGGSGNDSINNGSTSTTLFETVTGGAGNDVFRFGAAGADSTNVGTNSAAGTASGNDVITDMVSGVDKIAATGNPIANFSNIGSVTGTSLNEAAAAAEVILTQKYGAGTNGATFTYQGSTDTYALVATNVGGTVGTTDPGTNTTDLLVDIKATTALAKGDFIA